MLTLVVKDVLKHFFYFNKKGKAMEQVYKEAVKIRNSAKNDKGGAVEELIRKHEVKATKAIPSKQSQYQHLHKN